MQQLEGGFYNKQAGLYSALEVKPKQVASLWPTSQVLSAAIHVARLTGQQADRQRVRRIIDSLRNYLGPLGVFHALTVPSHTYYDDNNWIALDLLDAYDLLHDPAYLTLVKRIFAFEVTGWDTKNGGGIRWAVGHTDRPTVATAPVIIIGMRLAAITHQSYYQDWAARCYTWENTHLRGPDGLYLDHLILGAGIDRRFFSYNQGLMIEANLAYAARTGNKYYLDQARQIATLTAKLHPGPWHPRAMVAVFDAIYYEALEHLNQVSAGAASMNVAQEYLQWAWPVARAPRQGQDEDEIFEQAAFVISSAVVSSH
ncbi:MAG: glycoside hydrolase family 76 [Chloroflexi bacterium]|nr:glycoside hydrolase family 76 [Chloroflexota bacterium]